MKTWHAIWTAAALVSGVSGAAAATTSPIVPVDAEHDIILLIDEQPGVIDDRNGLPLPPPGEEDAADAGETAPAEGDAAIPAEAAPPLSPEEAAAIEKLVAQLGDDDFKVREAASEQLKAAGPAAVPALEAARKAGDAEIASRADALIAGMRRSSSLFGRPRDPNAGGLLGQRVRRTVANNSRLTEVFDGDQRIRVVESPNQLQVSVTITENGRQVTETVTARDPAELRNKNPDAFALYERWGGEGQGPVLEVPGLPGRQRRPLLIRPFPPGGGVPGPIIIRPGLAPAPEPAARADDLDRLRRDVRRQMRDAGTDPRRQRDVYQRIDELQLMQDDVAPADAPAVGDERMRAYNDKSDELRALLAELKLPDPGDALPPPAKARLGISIAAETPDGVEVKHVMAGSRAARLGLKPADVIRRINGEPVTTARDLRRLVTATDKPLVMDATRAGKAIKLEEKAE